MRRTSRVERISSVVRYMGIGNAPVSLSGFTNALHVDTCILLLNSTGGSRRPGEPLTTDVFNAPNSTLYTTY